MTSRPIKKTPATRSAEKFPDFPPRDDMQNSLHLDQPAHQATLSRHFGSYDTTIVLSEIPVRRIPGQQEGHRIPDLLIAFGVDRAFAVEQRGYSIRDQGKPPDFVLEVASPSTGREDYTGKRNDYAAFGIPEYWRFDPSGGLHHSAPLAGDRLVEGAYQPVEIQEMGPAHLHGHSDVLGLGPVLGRRETEVVGPGDAELPADLRRRARRAHRRSRGTSCCRSPRRLCRGARPGPRSGTGTPRRRLSQLLRRWFKPRLAQGR